MEPRGIVKFPVRWFSLLKPSKKDCLKFFTKLCLLYLNEVNDCFFPSHGDIGEDEEFG